MPGDPARNTLLLSRLPETCASSPCRSVSLEKKTPAMGTLFLLIRV